MYILTCFIGLIDYADGMVLCYQGLGYSVLDSARLRLLNLAKTRLEAAISNSTTNMGLRLQLG